MITTLFNRTADHIYAIHELGGIDLESYDNGPRGFGKLKLVTSDMKAALEETDVIMVVVPSSAHADIARSVAPYVKDGQIILLHPGRTCGAIEFAKVLKDMKCTADVTISEAETFIYASRSDGPAPSQDFSNQRSSPTGRPFLLRGPHAVLDIIHEAYPQYIDGGNVLQTGLNNMGAIFHPALTLLNAGRIESTHGDFEFYIDGATPSVAKSIGSTGPGKGHCCCIPRYPCPDSPGMVTVGI